MSELRLAVLEAAFEDVLEQAAYFESAGGPSLAKRWAAAVQSSIQSLTAMPLRGSAVEFASPDLRHMRRIPVRGFERHIVLYTVDGNESLLTVVAVLHTSRDIATLLATPRI